MCFYFLFLLVMSNIWWPILNQFFIMTLGNWLCCLQRLCWLFICIDNAIKLIKIQWCKTSLRGHELYQKQNYSLTAKMLGFFLHFKIIFTLIHSCKGIVTAFGFTVYIFFYLLFTHRPLWGFLVLLRFFFLFKAFCYTFYIFCRI